MGRHNLVLALVLLYAASFRLIVLDRPFRFDVEGHGCFYGVMARNYLRFGWVQTHGMPVLTAGQNPDAPIVFYADHSPLVPLLIAPVYALFGVGDWQTRLPTALATVAAVYVLYLLLKRFASCRIALIGAALFAATPMTLYFGGFPDVVGMPLVLFILLSIIGYLNLHRQPRLRTLLPLVFAFTLAAVTDWPAFIIVPVFLAHFLATQPHRQWPWIFVFCGAACALFATLYIYIALATNSPWDWMVPLFTKHSAVGVTAPFTVSQWFGTAMVNNRARHTLPLLIASGLWLITRGPRIRLSQPGATVARILIAWGLLHVMIARVGVYTDPWWWSPLTPGLAVSAALLVDSILRTADHRPFSHVAMGVAALLIVLFASWTGLTTFRELCPRTLDEPFTTVELGQAIRAAAPNPNDLAMLVGGDLGPQWWFYGDRPLRIDVWTVEDLGRRLRADDADITYGYWQPWNAAAAGIVFPTTWALDFAGFRAYLQQHYRSVPLSTALASKFEVFDLRHPSAGAP